MNSKYCAKKNKIKPEPADVESGQISLYKKDIINKNIVNYFHKPHQKMRTANLRNEKNRCRQLERSLARLSCRSDLSEKNNKKKIRLSKMVNSSKRRLDYLLTTGIPETDLTKVVQTKRKKRRRRQMRNKQEAENSSSEYTPEPRMTMPIIYPYPSQNVRKDRLQVIITDELAPLKRLSPDIWTLVEARLSEMVMNFVLNNDSNQLPSFDSSDIKGYPVIKCDDYFSLEFLHKIVARISNDWAGSKIGLVVAKMFLRRPEARIFIPKIKVEADQLLKPLYDCGYKLKIGVRHATVNVCEFDFIGDIMFKINVGQFC